MDYKMNVRQGMQTRPYYTGAGVQGANAYRSVPAGARPVNKPETKTDAYLAYPSLAMVYAPIERFEGLYTPEKALMRGTLFEKLDLPFKPGGC